jgi:hypothetical protein
MEISNVYQIIKKLADELVELHQHGGIELESWETAHNLVKEFYHTEEVRQIVIKDKVVK